jgi:replicative superfamily II helicase
MQEDDDLIASLPTSAGKTRIAELCILRCLASSKRAVFVTPLRSLSAQTERTLRRTFRPLGYDVSSLYGSEGASSGDIDSLGNRPIVVCTPEKLDFALRNDAALFDDVGLVVFDKGHMLGPTDRGLRYEVLVQPLLRRPDQAERRVVCLSAMLPDGEQEDDFVDWLRSGEAGKPIKGTWRPTRQRFGSIRFDERRNSFRYQIDVEGQESFVLDFVQPKTWLGPKQGEKHFPTTSSELCLASALRLAREGHSVLIYCPLKASVRALAKRFAELQKQKAVEGLTIDTDKLSKALYVGEEWLPNNHPVLTCLKAGIAVHHASLPRPFLREMDGLLADGILKITIASPTLAQ